MISKLTTIKSIGMNIAVVVQKKFTPFRNPRNRGGSPSGVSEPPMLATKKIKKTMIWTFCFRYILARIKGRINNIAAPVVPIQLAKTVPIRIIAVFTTGVPTNDPLSCTPPDIVNNANSRIIKGIYSNKPTCSNSYRVISNPSFIKKGIINTSAQKSEIFPKF